MTKTLNPLKATEAEIEAFTKRRCGSCGHCANEHAHMFGSDNYLCPTVSMFRDQSPDDLEFSGWVPEFTVWLVRRGSRFPMTVDSVFTDEKSAQRRAALLGAANGWKAMRYSHLTTSVAAASEL